MTVSKHKTVPAPTQGDSGSLLRTLSALRQNVGLLTGQEGGQGDLTILSISATTAEIITAINAIIKRLNGLV